MTENRHADDPPLLPVASAIARGERIDWSSVEPGTEAETATLEQLRVLENLSQMSDPVPATWGPFTIHDEIGQGSFGRVYRALDPTLNLEVALKVIRPSGTITEHDTLRALNEARLLARVTHPNVVRVYRAEQIGTDVGVSMELLDGRTLQDLVRQHGPMSGSETMLIGLDVCRALAAVHEAGLVHGDIKAANVMRAARGRTVLMDFGAGADLERDPIAARRIAGTPLYLAPELFSGGARTRVADIYSVGVLLYYLATGAYPVEGHTASDVERQHNQPATRRLLRDIRPDLPDAFITVVDRAAAVQPEARYQTAGELEAALKRALRGDDPVPDVRPFLLKWRPILAATIAVVAMGIGYSLWSARPDGRDRLEVPPPTLDAAVAPAPAPAAADAYRIEAAFYREEGGRRIRLEPGARVAPQDRISLQVTSSIPTYLFILNEDDKGAAYLLFPLKGHPLSNPLPPAMRHELPGVVAGERLAWEVSSAGGREHFLIFASPEPPSPAFQRMFASLPQPSVGGAPVPAPVSPDMAIELRGVGGLVKSPLPSEVSALTRDFTVPLSNIEETVRGAWVRQLTLENPVK